MCVVALANPVLARPYRSVYERQWQGSRDVLLDVVHCVEKAVFSVSSHLAGVATYAATKLILAFPLCARCVYGLSR